MGNVKSSSRNKIRSEERLELDSETDESDDESEEESEDEIVHPTTFQTSFETGSAKVTCHSRRRLNGTTTTVRTIDKTADGIRYHRGVVHCRWTNDDPFIAVEKDVIHIEDEFGNELSLGGFHKVSIAGFLITTRRMIEPCTGRRNYCLGVHTGNEIGLIHPESLQVQMNPIQDTVTLKARRMIDNAHDNDDAHEEIQLKIINKNEHENAKNIKNVPVAENSTQKFTVNDKDKHKGIDINDTIAVSQEEKEVEKLERIRLSSIDEEGIFYIRIFF